MGRKVPKHEHEIEFERAIKLADVQRALSTLERCSEAAVLVPTRLYNGLMSLLVHDPASFTYVREHMRAAGSRADESTLTLEVRHRVYLGDTSAAIELLERSAEEGVVPKLRTYSVVLQAVCERRDLDHALALQSQVGEAGWQSSEEQAATCPLATCPLATCPLATCPLAT